MIVAKGHRRRAAQGVRKWRARFDAIIPADIPIAGYPRDGETVAVCWAKTPGRRRRINDEVVEAFA